MKGILLSADFLATKESEQSNNIRWLKDLLSRPIQQATKITASDFKSVISEKNGFVRSCFFERSGIQFIPGEMQFDFMPECVSEDSIHYLQQHIAEETLLIGYELSAATRTILNRAKITYIDIWLHPIRYLDDVLFAFSSNNKDINQALGKFNLNENTYYAYADRLRVQSYKGFRRPKLDLHDNSALFVGQTLYDKAISHHGRMLTLLDYKHKFEQLCTTYSHVYYSRHPFVKTGDEEVMAYVRQHKNVSVIDEPAYFLLTSDEVHKVASISSSVVHEAKYFSKETDFFFRPVITIGVSEGDYSSIYQSFLFGHFWSAVLEPCFKVYPVQHIEYFESKDKIRDMLSFYWGYRNIDKLESLKQTVGTFYEKKNNVTQLSSATVSDWRHGIERASVVSFDVFDTLVSRNYYFPTDVLVFLESDARKATNGKIRNFRSNRLSAEKKVRTAAADNESRQEVTTEEIYLELQRIYDLSDTERSALLEVELSHEFKCSVRRDAGWEMFQYAKKLGKEIIAISDMTHEHSFICALLKKNGYDGFTKIYVSSQFGLRKHEGGLYEYVISDLKIDPSDVIHVGDNIAGDIRASQEKGFKSYHLARASVNLEKSGGYAQFIEELKSSKTNFDSLIFSAIARNYFDSPTQSIKPKTLFDGDAFKLGFSGMGPAITGFATWIYSEATNAGLTDIFFLSRDGEIAKKVFDTLYGTTPGAPKTHYIYASRRAARVSTIYCLADIFEIAQKHIYSTTIEDYLWSRFGLEKGTVPESIIQAHGFSGGAHPIGGKTPKDAILALVEYLKDEILLSAKSEREAYLRYLTNHGLLEAKSSALVDIGYAGSMQAALQRITGKRFLGLYFATFNSVRNEALDIEDIRGYVAHIAPSNGTNHGIQTHRFIYESLFCAPHDSFTCIKEEIDGPIPLFEMGENDDLRRALVTQIHGGVEAFASLIAEEHEDIRQLKVEPQCATRILDYWLRSPTIDDALILEGLKFHDPLGPSSTRYIVPPRAQRNDEKIQAASIWKEGLRAVQRLKSPAHARKPAAPPAVKVSAPPSPNKQALVPKGLEESLMPREAYVPTPKRNNLAMLLLHPIERKIILKTCSEKKIKKYDRERKRFFADAKRPAVRLYGKYSSLFFS